MPLVRSAGFATNQKLPAPFGMGAFFIGPRIGQKGLYRICGAEIKGYFGL